MARNKDSAAAQLPDQTGELLESKRGRGRPELVGIEGGVSAAEAEIKKKQAARMAEITTILEKWKGTPIADKANAILDQAWSAKENLDSVLEKLKAMLPTKEGVDAQKRAAKEAGEKLQVGESVTWKVGRTEHGGEFLGLTPTGSAKVQEQGKTKVTYVPANFLKKAEIIDLTEDMVVPDEAPLEKVQEKFKVGDIVTVKADSGRVFTGEYRGLSKIGLPQIFVKGKLRQIDEKYLQLAPAPTGIPDELLEAEPEKPKAPAMPDYTEELAALDRQLEAPLKKIESVIDFDDLISVVKEIGKFPAEGGKLLSAAAIVPILEEAKSGDAFSADSPIVMAMPNGVRQKVQELLDPRMAEVKGMIADVRDWNELIQVVKDIGHFTHPDGRPFKTTEIVKVLQDGKLDKRLEPNSPWVSAFPTVLQAKINELLTPIELQDEDLEEVKPGIEQPGDWEGPEIEPVDPADLPKTRKPGELPEGQKVKGLLTGRVRPTPPPPPGGDDIPVPPVEPPPVSIPEVKQLPPHQERPTETPEGVPDLAALRAKFAERDAELTNRYAGNVFGWVRRKLNPKGYQEVIRTRQEAYEEYARERAVEVKASVEKMLTEQIALADDKAQEFVGKRHWGQKLYDFYRKNPTIQRLKQVRTAVGIGLVGAGLAVGAPAVAAALGGAYVAWRLVGAAMAAPGSYELMRLGEEKWMSGFSKLKLDKENQRELDQFVNANKLGGFALFRKKEQRTLYNNKLLELQARQAPTLSEPDLDKMIQFYETTEIMKGLKPSDNPTYMMLMKEKARRAKEMLDEVDAGEEGNEREQAKFAEAVEAKKREKVDAKVSEAVACLLMGKAIESAGTQISFEGLNPQAQAFVRANLDWELYKKADQMAKEKMLKELKKKAQLQFHPDRNQADPAGATETLQEISQLVERLSAGRVEPQSGDANVQLLKDAQRQNFEKLPLEAQTILQRQEEKLGSDLAALHKRLLMNISVDGERKLDASIEAELRAALMNNETIAREAEEEVRAEIGAVVSAIESSRESVESKKAAVLELLQQNTDAVNRNLADKAKTRKDVMKLTAIAVALIGGYLVSKLSGQEAQGSGGKPVPGSSGHPPVGPGQPPVGPDDGPFKPWNTPPIENAKVGPEFIVESDAFKPGEGVIRFSERLAGAHQELFKGMTNPQIEKWSIDLLLKKGLIEIDKARGLVGYKFVPHPGDTARIISDASGKPIDFEFLKGVRFGDKPLMWIPLPKSELAGRDLTELYALMDRSVELAGAAKRSTTEIAARAAARMIEEQRIRESASEGFKWFFEKGPEPDAILPPVEDKLEWGL